MGTWVSTLPILHIYQQSIGNGRIRRATDDTKRRSFRKIRDAHTLSKLSGVKLVTIDGEERISFPTKNRKDTDAGINLYHEIQNVPGLLEYNTTESCSIAYDEELQEEYILANPAAIDEVSAETLIKEREEERLEPGITVRGEGEGVIGIQVLDFEICQEMKDEVDDNLV